MAKSLDLDVDSPEEVVKVLDNAIQSFYESAQELEGAWQEKSAGHPWDIIAQELEKALEKIEDRLENEETPETDEDDE